MPGFAIMVDTSTMPVSAQMTTVDQNVPVMAMSACSAGLRVLAAAATMGADPRPDSLEKSPRAQPNCRAIMMPLPTAPPNAALPVNAHWKMSATASPTTGALSARMTRQPPAYATAMTGTSFSHTFEMVRTPPKITTETSTTMPMPMAQVGTGTLDAMMPRHGGRLHGRPRADGGHGGERGERHGAQLRPPGGAGRLPS